MGLELGQSQDLRGGEGVVGIAVIGCVLRVIAVVGGAVVDDEGGQTGASHAGDQINVVRGQIQMPDPLAVEGGEPDSGLRQDVQDLGQKVIG